MWLSKTEYKQSVLILMKKFTAPFVIILQKIWFVYLIYRIKFWPVSQVVPKYFVKENFAIIWKMVWRWMHPCIKVPLTAPNFFFCINKLLLLPWLLWQKSFWPWIFPSDVEIAFSFNRMPDSCIVFGCNNKSDPENGIALHRIPFFKIIAWSEWQLRRKKMDFAICHCLCLFYGQMKHWCHKVN